MNPRCLVWVSLAVWVLALGGFSQGSSLNPLSNVDRLGFEDNADLLNLDMQAYIEPEEDDSENDVEAQMSNAEGEEVDEVWVLASMKEDPEILFNGKSPTRNDFVNKAIADYIISWNDGSYGTSIEAIRASEKDALENFNNRFKNFNQLKKNKGNLLDTDILDENILFIRTFFEGKVKEQEKVEGQEKGLLSKRNKNYNIIDPAVRLRKRHGQVFEPTTSNTVTDPSENIKIETQETSYTEEEGNKKQLLLDLHY